MLIAEWVYLLYNKAEGSVTSLKSSDRLYKLSHNMLKLSRYVAA